MQTLGLSKSTPRPESRIKGLLWPDVATAPGAKTALDIGRVVAFLIAGGTAVMVVLGMAPLFSLADTVIFSALGFGIGRGSRVCAGLAAALYILGQVFIYGAGQGGFNIIMPIIFSFVLLNALRAAIMLRRLRARSQTPAPPIPTQGITLG